jgi:hypothetical protein
MAKVGIQVSIGAPHQAVKSSGEWM